MKSYYRVMLGKKSMYAEECFKQGFIGAHFDIEQNLKNDLPDNWREFNHRFIPIYLQRHPDKSKVTAGLACGALWTIAKGIKKGDIVLCPNGDGGYKVGEVVDDYSYVHGKILPHRRSVSWYPRPIDRLAMSDSLQKSTGSSGTISNVTKYAKEIEALIEGNAPPTIISTDETIEDPTNFALEKHLEDFLVQNWEQTELGKKYNIYAEDGELIGQQYQTDTGNMDILAISKDQKELLVVELKKGRASDAVVGQILRYMGYVSQELAESGQSVKGVIIALEDDIRIRRALAMTQGIQFYRYQISFKLLPVY
jgi:restriction system protein